MSDSEDSRASGCAPPQLVAQCSVDNPLPDRLGFRKELVHKLLTQLAKECTSRPPIVLPSAAARGTAQQGGAGAGAASALPAPIAAGFGRRADGAYWKVKPASLGGPIGPFQSRAQSSCSPTKFLLALCKALSSGFSSNVTSIGEEHRDEFVRTFHSDLFGVLLSVAKLGIVTNIVLLQEI